MLLKSSAMASRDYLTSKSNINAHKLINVIDLIKKVKLEEKKEKRHTLLLVVSAMFVLVGFGFVISF